MAQAIVAAVPAVLGVVAAMVPVVRSVAIKAGPKILKFASEHIPKIEKALEQAAPQIGEFVNKVIFNPTHFKQGVIVSSANNQQNPGLNNTQTTLSRVTNTPEYIEMKGKLKNILKDEASALLSHAANRLSTTATQAQGYGGNTPMDVDVADRCEKIPEGYALVDVDFRTNSEQERFDAAMCSTIFDILFSPEYMANGENFEKHLSIFERAIGAKLRNPEQLRTVSAEVRGSMLTHIVFSAIQAMATKNCTCPFCPIVGPGDISRTKLARLRALSRISTHKHSVAILISSYYNVSLCKIKFVLTYNKHYYNSKRGTKAFDLSFSILDLYKGYAYINAYNENNLYGGMIYGQSFELPNTDYGLQRISDDLSSAIISDPACTLSYVYATGTPNRPKHWCAIFVDYKTLTIYIYNSLVKSVPHIEDFVAKIVEHTVCVKNKKNTNAMPGDILRLVYEEYSDVGGIGAAAQTLKSKYGFTIKKNFIKHQTDSAFCGLYTIKFIRKMLWTPSHLRAEIFMTVFNHPGDYNVDGLMGQIYTKTINPNNDDHNLERAISTILKDIEVF